MIARCDRVHVEHDGEQMLTAGFHIGGVVQHDQLANISTPTLFIAGAEDPLFPSEQLAALVPHFPNARIEIVQDAGHSPYFEQPDTFNHLLTDHLS